MATFISNSLISVLLTVLFLLPASTIASSDYPFIVTHKKTTLNRLIFGFEQVFITIDIYNKGSEKKFEWAKRLLAKYGSLISKISIVVLFVYLVASPSSKSSAAKGSKKKR